MISTASMFRGAFSIPIKSPLGLSPSPFVSLPKTSLWTDSLFGERVKKIAIFFTSSPKGESVHRPSQNPFNTKMYRVFSLTWPASMQIYWNKRKRLHKKRVQLPQDWFRTPTWRPSHCFGTPICPPWRHVKTLYKPRA